MTVEIEEKITVPVRERNNSTRGHHHEPLSSVAMGYTSPDLRRSQRMTPATLFMRERALLYDEQEFKKKSGELQERNISLSRRVDEASLKISQFAKREAQTMFSQLEEHFTCPLWVLQNVSLRLRA